MRLEYDHKADAIYLYLSSRKEKVWKSREVEAGVVIDLNKKKQVIGIEILEASHRFRHSELHQVSLKHVGELARVS